MVFSYCKWWVFQPAMLVYKGVREIQCFDKHSFGFQNSNLQNSGWTCFCWVSWLNLVSFAKHFVGSWGIVLTLTNGGFPDVCTVLRAYLPIKCPSLKIWSVCVFHCRFPWYGCCSSRKWSEVLSKHDFDFMLVVTATLAVTWTWTDVRMILCWLVGFNKVCMWSTHMQLHKRSKTTTEKWLRKVTDIHVPWILTSLNAKQKSSDLNIQLRLDCPPTCCRWHYFLKSWCKFSWIIPLEF